MQHDEDQLRARERSAMDSGGRVARSAGRRAAHDHELAIYSGRSMSAAASRGPALRIGASSCRVLGRVKGARGVADLFGTRSYLHIRSSQLLDLVAETEGIARTSDDPNVLETLSLLEGLLKRASTESSDLHVFCIPAGANPRRGFFFFYRYESWILLLQLALFVAVAMYLGRSCYPSGS